ncbi:MAG: 16S rRNA (cytosine(967)-C(5))-methyltransferase RsmB [Gammaproteobacteria bacterium]|nr:16S rRNA (cytosine(967)-C(5))-methyltransferase RsmB [Gammaproteobacteria bacterium]
MSQSKTGARIRAAAAEAVDAVVSRGRSLDPAIAKAEIKLAPADRPLLRVLCYGALRFHWRLTAQAAKFLKRPLKERDSVIDALLRIGIFQLGDTRISDHAVVSLTAEAARILRRPKLVPLVNAVLRNFLRSDKSLPQSDGNEIQYNHPAWFVERVREDWPDHWQRILNANNQRAPMWLRVNRYHGTAEQYLQVLAAARGVEKTKVGTVPTGFDQAICLTRPWAVDDLPGFRDGRVSVQDGAAQVAAPWLLTDGGRRLLDACAAPGGKTGHLLELAEPSATLTAIDSDPARVDRITENLDRLGLSANVLTADAGDADRWWDRESFDRILLDAPCSASGVIRRHPDIKLLRRADDIEAMARLQLGLLERLWPLLAARGRLLYVTCSVLRQENDAVVRQFKARHGDVSAAAVLPNNNIRDLMVATSQGFQVLPGTHELDGFYFACLEKNPD